MTKTPSPHSTMVKQLLLDTPLDNLIDLDSVKPLAGGVVSLILSASLKSDIQIDNIPGLLKPPATKQLVIKHTYLPDDIPLSKIFGHTDQVSLHEKAHLTQDLDQQILKLFQLNDDVTVPELIFYSKQKRVTVMEDFGSKGFVLMQSLIIEDKLPKSSANSWGKMLAITTQTLKNESSNFIQVEQSLTQIRERLEELYGFLRVDLELYREIENKFVTSTFLIDPDVHPKNIAIDQKGKPILFDFGRAIKADIQHVPATFAAHLALATIGGCFSQSSFGTSYLFDYLSAYNDASPQEDKINEKWFVRYFVAELLHRGMSGRWLDPNLFKNSSLQEVERAIHDLGIEVFRPDQKKSSIDQIDQVLGLVDKISQKVQAGAYRGSR